MKTKQHPFTGIWYVAVKETRTAGKWESEYEFAPGEWLIGFTPEGNYLETFRPENEQTTFSQWCFDESSGIISICADPPVSVPLKCVFGGGGPFLYYYDDLPHIPKNAAAVIEHHAHTRLKLTRTEDLGM